VFEGLNLIIPMLAILGAGIAGLVFVIAGWHRFRADAAQEPKKSAPKPLLAFTAAVGFDFALYPALYALSDSALFQGYVFNIEAPRAALAIGFAVSAVLHLIALGLTVKGAGPTAGIVRWGSIASLSIEGLGVVLFLVA